MSSALLMVFHSSLAEKKKKKESKDDYSLVDDRAAGGCRLKPRAASGVPGVGPRQSWTLTLLPHF